MVGQGTGVFGDDLLPWLLLAFGAAMVVGNGLALIRPPTPRPNEKSDAGQGGEPGDRAGGASETASASPQDSDEGTPTPARPPLARSLTFMGLGAIVAIWALASLIS